MALHIPDLAGEESRLDAALAYAAAGWYVGPCKAGSKHPGSILGATWQTRTSRDPATITAWFAGTDCDLYLHMGRSGALGIDLDSPKLAPKVLKDANKRLQPPVQQTRPEEDPGRSHVIYATPPGRRFGNSVGQLGNGWGEVRGHNGILLVAPASDGRRWFRTGVVPELPEEISSLLPDGSIAEASATDERVQGFLRSHVLGDGFEMLDKLVAHFTRQVEAGESRHQAMVSIAAGAMKEAAVGLYPAKIAADSLEDLFIQAVTKDGRGRKQGEARSHAQAASEWRGIMAWGIAQAEVADAASTRERIKAHEHAPEVIEVEGQQQDPSGRGAGSAGTGPAPFRPDVDDSFWEERALLLHIRAFARARLVAPWAVLGATLARIATATPYSIHLPPIIGGIGSLNQFVALVAPSGGGKGAAVSVSAEAVRVTPEPRKVRIASGEAITHVYKHREPGNPVPVWRDPDHAALIDVSEIDRLAGQKSRQGSTIMADLRSAWSGELLGQVAADRSRSLPLEDHQYRLCLIAGVQPAKAGAILDDADGGTPQRFLWVPGIDPDAPAEIPETPEPVHLNVDLGLFGTDTMEVCRTAEQAIIAARQQHVRMAADPLDGHALQAQLKVAAAFAVSEQRYRITDEDWELAGVLLEVSKQTRRWAQDVIRAEATKSALAKAEADARREGQVEKIRDQRGLQLAADAILRRLSLTPHAEDWVSRREIHLALSRATRPHFAQAVHQLLQGGQIEGQEGSRGGQQYRLRVAPHDPS